MVAMARKPKTTERELVYAGSLHHEDGLVHAYYFVTERGDLEERVQLYPEALGSFPPGAVCKYGVQTNGAVVTEGATFVRVWPEEALVHEWTVRHGATLASEAAWTAQELPKAFSCLEPIRAAYRRLDEERQGVLVAQIVRYLVTPDD